MAAMTTITIFLPAPVRLINSSCFIIREKPLYYRTRSLKKLSRNWKMKVLPFLILCFTTAALADDFKLVTGKEYKNVTVSRVEPDGIVLRTNRESRKCISSSCPTTFSNVFITMPRSLLPIPHKHNKPSIRRQWPLPVAANRSN